MPLMVITRASLGSENAHLSVFDGAVLSVLRQAIAHQHNVDEMASHNLASELENV